MSTNYYLVSVDPGAIHQDWQVQETLLGTQHFTHGKKTFTFILPISELFNACLNDYADDLFIKKDGDNARISLYEFIKTVIATSDVVKYERIKV